MPPGVADLPRFRGYPVPFFVQWFKNGLPCNFGEGEPDLRFVDERKPAECYRRMICWICGQPLHYRVAFIGGPISVKNRTFGDGPMHMDCAEYSALACPHLINPKAKRREGDDRAKQTYTSPGATKRHPDKVAVYITRKFFIEKSGGCIIWVAEAPVEMRWFKEGKRIDQ